MIRCGSGVICSEARRVEGAGEGEAREEAEAETEAETGSGRETMRYRVGSAGS